MGSSLEGGGESNGDKGLPILTCSLSLSLGRDGGGRGAGERERERKKRACVCVRAWSPYRQSSSREDGASAAL